ncbi:NAD(P)/FAD-dependent oxidoreductase [Sphingomonas sp. ASY06-1R]|uniref:NAD(P)/FAD-dependent oxidoreductase n=1 Tax=Sphingomonas sp. ASY06-1R TaxID=3445771 RepID=UPI003FA2BA89
MSSFQADIAIIGAGIAGASLAAMIGDRARTLLIEAESQPGYHSTGRSAAFWSESYGGPLVQPLTTASGPWMAARGFLHPRGCIHIATTEGRPALATLAEELDAGGVDYELLERAALEQAIPRLSAAFVAGLSEPTCQDIDVAALHGHFLGEAKRAGAQLLTDAAVETITRAGDGWEVRTRAGVVRAPLLVNAAGAWASPVATLAGASPIEIQPYRRTMAQLITDPPMAADMPLVMDALGRFYFRPETGGRLWLSPHDETAVAAHDVAPEELDVAIAIDQFEHVVDWRVVRRERAWAGLRSFAPDRLPVYGFDPVAPGFFWFAGQGGFGIQTAPAAAMVGAALLLDAPLPEAVSGIDVGLYGPGRFA